MLGHEKAYSKLDTDEAKAGANLPAAERVKSWIWRNRIPLSCVLLAIIGLICLLVGLLQACETGSRLTPRGADVMILVDGSNSMTNDEFQDELRAANVLLGSLGTAENRSWAENNFNAGLIQCKPSSVHLVSRSVTQSTVAACRLWD